MDLKELRDDLSRRIARGTNPKLNHVLIEDVTGNQLVDYMLRDETDEAVVDWDEESEDDSELEEESWKDDMTDLFSD